MKIERVLILGGSGFIGSSVAEFLTREGYFVTVPTRRFDRAKHLSVMPTLEVIEANVFDPATLEALIKRHDAVINLVGILNGDFEAVHVAFPKMVAEICARNGVARFIHVSALTADAKSPDSLPSEYLRSRGRGEAAVWTVAGAATAAAATTKQQPNLNVTVFRPSIVFGEHDKFLNLFAKLVKLFPILPLGSANAQFQPVWVEDVAHAIVASLKRSEAFGQTYALAGPAVYTLRELIEFVAKCLGKRPLIIGLGAGLSMLQGAVFGLLPGKLITPDNVRSMSVPNTSAERFPSFANHPAALEAVVPTYLGHGSGQGTVQGAGRSRYQALRNRAGRSIDPLNVR
jgi:uncharacterized protein YbjT (DUF2867 family)